MLWVGATLYRGRRASPAMANGKWPCCTGRRYRAGPRTEDRVQHDQRSGDTVARKPAFRSAYKRRRCLVLADGYYECEKAGKAKLPRLYELKDQQPFDFAGL